MNKKCCEVIVGLVLTAGMTVAQTVEIDRTPLTVASNGQISVTWKALKHANGAIQVTDASGRPIRTLDAGGMTVGSHTSVIDGKLFAPGQYKLRVGVGPTASSDPSFGVNGMLGVLTKKSAFKGDRKIPLNASVDPRLVTVKVDGEKWDQVSELTAPGSNYVIDAASGLVELNAAIPLDEGAEVAIQYPGGFVFENPWCVRTAPDGSVLISDLKSAPAKSVLYKVDADGKPMTDFGNTGALETAVYDLAVDQDGILYIAAGGHAIGVYGPKGDYRYAVGGYINPYREGEHLYEGGYSIISLALNAEKRAVIVNGGNGTDVIYDVTKTNFDGFIALQTAKEGAAYAPVWGRRWGPCVTMTGNDFYQTTCRNNLVKFRFDPATKKFTKVWSTFAREDLSIPDQTDSLFHGLDVKLDGSGLIYVADRLHSRIQIYFDAGETWKHVGSIGSAGSDVSKVQMKAPHSIALSPDGKSMYVADDGTFYQVTVNSFSKGLARVTKLTLGFQETIELPLEVK